MEIGFEPKKIIEPQVYRLNVLAADKAEDYGLQIGLKLKVAGGEHNGYTLWTTPTEMRSRARSSRAPRLGASSRLVLAPTSTSAQASG